MKRFATLLVVAIVVVLCLQSTHAAATADLFDSGRLLGTACVSAVEGQGGVGVVPWALISGYGTH